MAIVRATKTGNWSDTTVWNTGALPTAADDVYSNTFTVTIDQSATVLQISNAAATGVTAGGGFTMSAGGYTLTANVNASGTVTCLTVSNGAGTTATVVGNVQAGSTGSGSTARGIIFSGAGILNVTGAVTGGTGNNSKGVEVTGTGTCNITGNVTGSQAVTPATSYGAENVSTGTLVITGTCTAGTNAVGYAALNSSTGTLSHIGTAQASATTPAIGPGAIGQVTTLTGPLLSTTTAQSTAAASGVNPCVAVRWFPADTALSTFSYTMRGATVSGGIRPERVMYLPDAYASGQPTAANVRSGTVYGPDNVYTGTCAVPGAGSVALGVAVDNTTGTAVLTEANVRAAVGLASANLDAQFAAIPAAPSAAAIRTEMDSNSTKLANLDATVSSRSTYSGADTSGTTTLLSRLTGTRAGYLDNLATAPPTALDIASAVWSAATRTLTTAIDNSATIAAAVWNSLTASYSTNGTFGKQVLIGSTSQREVTVTGSHHVAADIHELQPAVIESSHFAAGALDGVRSSIGLASANLDTQLNAIPTAAENATATRSELAPELARMANAATTQEVGDIVEGAM